MRIFFSFFIVLNLSVFGTSFDCSKAQSEVEKMICANPELSALDENLSKAFIKVLKATDDKDQLKKEQFAWIRKRDKCKSNECLQQHYNNQIQILSQSSIINIDNLLEAQKIASENYAKSKNIYPSIDMLKRAGIEKIFKKQPLNLSPEQYASLLSDYALYLSQTDDDIMHGKNLHKSIDILTIVVAINSDNPELHLRLARAYKELFIFSKRTTKFISGRMYQSDAYDDSYITMAPVMKKAYVDYVNVCKRKGITPQLTEQEWMIVKRNQMFFDYHSTYNRKSLWLPTMDGQQEYKPTLTNVCSDYVEMLNHLPDNNMTECSRYVNQKNSQFQYMTKVQMPQQYQILLRKDDLLGTVSGHYVKYKNEYFIDSFGDSELISAQADLESIKIGYLNKEYCKYMFIDFRKTTYQKGESSCGQIRNYETIYTNQN